MTEGRTRITRARAKQAKLEGMWRGEPDLRPRKRCYFCRRNPVIENLRYWAKPQKGKKFYCPVCRGHNFQFLRGLVAVAESVSHRPCPLGDRKKHDASTCRTAECFSRRLFKIRKAYRP